MGIFGRMNEWYTRHKVVRAFATAAESVALLNAGAGDAAAAIFSKGPVSAPKMEAEKQSPLAVSGDARVMGRWVDGTAGTDWGSADARVRLNLDYTPSDILKLGARGVAEYSAHPPFDHRFIDDHHKIFVDRAFADLMIGDGLSLRIGAFENTLTGWHDADVPLVGGQLAYTGKNVSVLDRFGAKLVYHGGQPWLDESDSRLVAFEVQGGKALAKHWSISGSANYMYWYDMDPDSIFKRTNVGRGSGYASDFRIANAGVKLTNSKTDVPVFGPPLSVYVTGMHNFGAREKNDGVIAGVSLGSLKEPGDLSFCFEFRWVEADAANAGYAPKVTPFTDMTLPSIILSYQITDRLSVVGVGAFPVGISADRGSWNYASAGLCCKF